MLSPSLSEARQLLKERPWDKISIDEAVQHLAKCRGDLPLGTIRTDIVSSIPNDERPIDLLWSTIRLQENLRFKQSRKKTYWLEFAEEDKDALASQHYMDALVSFLCQHRCFETWMSPLQDKTLPTLTEWDQPTVPLSLAENLRVVALRQLLTLLRTRKDLFKHLQEMHGLEMVVDIFNFPKISNSSLMILLDIISIATRLGDQYIHILYKLRVFEVVSRLSKEGTHEDVSNSALQQLELLSTKLARMKKQAKATDLASTAQVMLEIMCNSTEDLGKRQTSTFILYELLVQPKVNEFVAQQLQEYGLTRKALLQIVSAKKTEITNQNFKDYISNLVALVGKLASGNKENQEAIGKIPGLLPKIVKMITWDMKGSLGFRSVGAIQNSCGRVPSNRKQVLDANGPSVLWQFFMTTKGVDIRKQYFAEAEVVDSNTPTPACVALGALNSLAMDYLEQVADVVKIGEVVKLLDDGFEETLGYMDFAAVLSIINHIAKRDPSKGTDPMKYAVHFANVCKARSTDHLPLLTVLGVIYRKVGESPKFFMRMEPDQVRSLYQLVARTLARYEEIYNQLSAKITMPKGTKLEEDFEWIPSNLLIMQAAASCCFNKDIFEKSDKEKQTICSRAGCVNAGKLLMCARCRQVSYCGKDCQARDWKSHKQNCQPK